MGMSEVSLKIDGMHCDACVRRVTKAIESVQGVRVREVKLGAARVEIPGDGDAGALVNALDRAGFRAEAV